MIKVSTTAELTAALKAAIGGEVIGLAPGVYSGLTYKVAPAPASEVVITSADPDNRASVTDFSLTRARNLTFRGLDLLALPHPEIAVLDNYVAFKFFSCTNLRFEGVGVHGSLNGSADDDVCGISIRNSSGVVVTGCEFQQLGRGLALGQTVDITLTNNRVHDLRSDGFNLSEVQRVRISGNSFRDFRPQGGDHPDCIQFWTTANKTPSTDILITGNLIERGDGAYTQGIFLRDQLGTLPFERVTISDNLINGTGYSGIRVNGVRGLVMHLNELVSWAGENRTFLLIQAGDDIASYANKGAQMGYDKSTNVRERGNALTSVVADKGAAAVAAWRARHP